VMGSLFPVKVIQCILHIKLRKNALLELFDLKPGKAFLSRLTWVTCESLGGEAVVSTYCGKNSALLTGLLYISLFGA